MHWCPHAKATSVEDRSPSLAGSIQILICMPCKNTQACATESLKFTSGMLSLPPGEAAADGDAAAAGGEEEAAQQLRREHMLGALHALRNILEAQPRLSALMASRPALAPLLACIEPSCRYAAWLQEIHQLHSCRSGAGASGAS